MKGFGENAAFLPTFSKVYLVSRSKHVEFRNGRFYLGRLAFIFCLQISKKERFLPRRCVSLDSVKLGCASSRSSSFQTNEKKKQHLDWNPEGITDGYSTRSDRQLFAGQRQPWGCGGQRQVSFRNDGQTEAEERARFARNAQRPPVVSRDELNSLNKHRVSYCFNLQTEIWGEKPRVYIVPKESFCKQML